MHQLLLNVELCHVVISAIARRLRSSFLLFTPMDFFTLDSLPSDLYGAIASRTLVPEQILFHQGDAAAAFFIVQSGRIKIIRHTPEQRNITIQIAQSGDSFGESALFSDVYSCTAIADLPSQLIAYPKQPLLSALRQNADLAEDFMRLLVKKNESLIVQLELRDIRAAHTRVLQYLRYLAEPGDRMVVKFDRPLKEIANDLGLTPATLSRSMTRLEQEGVISREQSSITLHDSSAA